MLALAAAGLNFTGEHRGHGGLVGDLVQGSTTAFSTPFTHEAAGGHEGVAADHGPRPFTPLGQAAVMSEEPGTILGKDPHEAMYYVSAAVGALGIIIAFFLHLAGRTTAGTSKADALLPALGSLPTWAQHKWYVDEFYDFLIVKPLLVLSHIFHLIDKLLVDGLVDLFGAIPRWVGKALRPSQNGELHGYAVGMAGGLAVLLVIVMLVTAL